MTDFRRWVWLCAMVLWLLTPFTALFGADPLRVLAVGLFEFGAAALITYWIRRDVPMG